MRYFDEELVANSRPHQTWWGEVTAVRNHFHEADADLWTRAVGNGLTIPDVPSSVMRVLAGNAAAILPRDAWLDFDNITRKVMYEDEGQAYMNDLMPLARSIHIGKLVSMTRIHRGGGTVTRSMTGQVPELMSKGEYDYRGTLVPIFSTGFGRSWREWNTLMSENFDALADDQADSTRIIREDMADYVLDGDLSLQFEGQTGYGIRTHPLSKSINLGSATGGANIDLTSATATSDDIDNFFTYTLGAMLDANKVTSGINLYISPEIARNWDRSYSGSAGFKGGRLVEYLRTNRRLRNITVTSKLSGNEFFGFVPSSEYIRPVVGLATNTTPMVRTNPVDDYNFLVMGAMGLDIRADWNGNSGVFYSVDID